VWSSLAHDLHVSGRYESSIRCARQAEGRQPRSRRAPLAASQSPYGFFSGKIRLQPEGEARGRLKWTKNEKNVCFWTNSVYTLAYCEWREAAPGLQPLRLPRPQAPTYPMNTHVRFEQNSQPKEQYRPPDPINHVYSLTGK